MSPVARVVDRTKKENNKKTLEFPIELRYVFGPEAPHPKHHSLEEPRREPLWAARPQSLPKPQVGITSDSAIPRAVNTTIGQTRGSPLPLWKRP